MQTEEPIFVDDPVILAMIARLAAMDGCTEEEAIGIAVSAELAARREAVSARDGA
ncbi:hypothetical protein [Bosea sp. PAMC 26642]|uniref:hypothetical protein n=1 Tax=Bosea sp. (strain PAMC 26642) TaxID=1792307 RepID=UPI000A476892|nr:hypothetical protein [Bosea sp. PAMC 26642]